MRLIFTTIFGIYFLRCSSQTLEKEVVNHLFVVCDMELKEIRKNNIRLIQGFSDDGVAILFYETNPPLVLVRGSWTILKNAIWVHFENGQNSSKFYQLENTEHFSSGQEILVNIGAFK